MNQILEDQASNFIKLKFFRFNICAIIKDLNMDFQYLFVLIFCDQVKMCGLEFTIRYKNHTYRYCSRFVQSMKIPTVLKYLQMHQLNPRVI